MKQKQKNWNINQKSKKVKQKISKNVTKDREKNI